VSHCISHLLSTKNEVCYAKLFNLKFSDDVLICVTGYRSTSTVIKLPVMSHTQPDNVDSIFKMNDAHFGHISVMIGSIKSHKNSCIMFAFLLHTGGQSHIHYFVFRDYRKTRQTGLQN
jgi:hypothetical protein